MGSFHWDSGVFYGTNIAGLFDRFAEDCVFSSLCNGGLPPSLSSLVLDSESGELVWATQKRNTEAKVVAAKNHSEAERRRRERINFHLNTLRYLLPCTEKMSKPSLLAEVINHVKELKKTAAEACEGFVIPMDFDEVRVEPHEDGEEGLFCIKVSLCCEDRPELLTDLRQALDTFCLKTVKAEISTLGGRVKNVFVLAGFNIENIDDAEVRRHIIYSVHQALASVLDKYFGSTE